MHHACYLVAVHIVLNKISAGGSLVVRKDRVECAWDRFAAAFGPEAPMPTGYMTWQVVSCPLWMALRTDCYVPKPFCLNWAIHTEQRKTFMIFELHSTFLFLKNSNVCLVSNFFPHIWLFKTFPSVLLRNASLCKSISLITGKHFFNYKMCMEMYGKMC